MYTLLPPSLVPLLYLLLSKVCRRRRRKSYLSSNKKQLITLHRNHEFIHAYLLLCKRARQCREVVGKLGPPNQFHQSLKYMPLQPQHLPATPYISFTQKVLFRLWMDKQTTHVFNVDPSAKIVGNFTPRYRSLCRKPKM